MVLGLYSVGNLEFEDSNNSECRSFNNIFSIHVLTIIKGFCHLLNVRYTTSRKEPAPAPPQRKIFEERMVMKETPPPAEEAPPLRPLEPKQRITQEELTIEEVRRQPYSVPPPKNEYHYHEEVLPPPDEYHFEEKRTDLLASAPDSMDTRKSRLLVMPWLNVWVPFGLVKRFLQSRES